MKKSFLSLLTLFLISVSVNAQVTNEPNPMAHTPSTQPENNYWYYPSQNVYYNDAGKSYWYYDKSAAKWQTATTLSNPYMPLTDADTRYKVSYRGNDVWKGNATHKMKYKVKKNGTVKTKMKPAKN